MVRTRYHHAAGTAIIGGLHQVTVDRDAKIIPMRTRTTTTTADAVTADLMTAVATQLHPDAVTMMMTTIMMTVIATAIADVTDKTRYPKRSRSGTTMSDR